MGGVRDRCRPKERERLTQEKKPIRNEFEAEESRDGEPRRVNEISAFSFSPDGRFIALTRYAAEGKKTSEVLLQDLTTSARLSLLERRRAGVGGCGIAAWR